MIRKKISHRRLLWLTFALLLFVLLLTARNLFLFDSPPDSGDFAPPGAVSLDDIDAALRESVTGNIAYNTPETMQLGQTVSIEVLLSPVLSGEELARQIVAQGPVAFDELRVTDRMQATLQGADANAFTIQPLQSDPVQLVSTVEPTRWRWTVEALEPGSQRLILTVERFVEVGGEVYLRPVTSFENTITVDVTAAQWLQRGGWLWLLAAVLVPGGLLTAAYISRRRVRPVTEIPGLLSAERYAQVRDLLLSCGPFGDEDELRAIYVDPRIRHWRDQMPDADSALERVEITVDFLTRRANKQGENGLILLVHVLRDRMSEEDSCYAQLERLEQGLREEIGSFSPPVTTLEIDQES